MTSMTAGDVLVNTLTEWGVDTVFGIPGDGVNGIIESLRRRKDDIRFIQVRHEEAAAFAACAYAKWTGRLGVCVATSGPGGIHLLNGLYDAKLDQAPVLAITGLQFHDLLQTYTQQDVELDKLYMDVAVYNARVMGAAHASQRHRSRLPRRARLSGVSRMSLCQSTYRTRSITQDARTPSATFPITSRTKWGGSTRFPPRNGCGRPRKS